MHVAIRYFTKSKKGNTKKLAKTVSEALGLPAESVETDLTEKADRLILINAMYAADIDPEVKAFLERNREKIGEVFNMNTSATGRSTLPAVKKAAEKLGVAVSDRAFHCRASWIFMNQGLPGEAELTAAAEFAKSVLN